MLVALIDPILDLFIRLVKFAGIFLRLQIPDDFFEQLDRIQTGAALVALHMQFHLARFADGDLKFALRHKKVGVDGG